MPWHTQKNMLIFCLKFQKRWGENSCIALGNFPPSQTPHKRRGKSDSDRNSTSDEGVRVTASAKAPAVDAASYAIWFLILLTTTYLIEEQSTQWSFLGSVSRLRITKGGLELLFGFGIRDEDGGRLCIANF